MIQTLIFFLIGHFSIATEASNPQVKSDFLLIEEQLETTLYGLCSWDEKVVASQNPNEFYTEILCTDGSYDYKFRSWLTYGASTTFRAESYAVAESNKWFCTLDGGIDRGSIYSEMACSLVESTQRLVSF